jgi:hypothetical protein
MTNIKITQTAKHHSGDLYKVTYNGKLVAHIAYTPYSHNKTHLVNFYGKLAKNRSVNCMSMASAVQSILGRLPLHSINTYK